MWKRAREIVHEWYQGEFVIHENDPSSGVVFIGGDYRRHWTADIARVLASFWLKHWKWLIGLVVAITAVVINARR